VEAVVRLAAHVGPTARMLREKNGGPEDLEAIQRELATQLRPYLNEDGVRIPAKINIFTGRNA
jgi:hypothetical protein